MTISAEVFLTFAKKIEVLEWPTSTKATYLGSSLKSFFLKIP